MSAPYVPKPRHFPPAPYSPCTVTWGSTVKPSADEMPSVTLPEKSPRRPPHLLPTESDPLKYAEVDALKPQPPSRSVSGMLNGMPLKVEEKLNFGVTVPAQGPEIQTTKPSFAGTVISPRSIRGFITRFSFEIFGVRSTQAVLNAPLAPVSDLNLPPNEPEARNTAFGTKLLAIDWLKPTSKLFRTPPLGNVPEPLNA